MTNSNNSTKPTHNVFVVEGDGEKAYWTKIGVAWQHNDGEGLNVTLSAAPINGRMVIRTPKAEIQSEDVAEP